MINNRTVLTRVTGRGEKQLKEIMEDIFSHDFYVENYIKIDLPGKLQKPVTLVLTIKP